MVEVGDPAHVVVEDGGGGEAPDLLDLQAVELAHHVRGEAAEGEGKGRVRLGNREVGEVHSDPVRDLHGPEDAAMGAVHGLGALVAAGEPFAEGVAGGAL
jgi:hypothetical protein